MSESAGYVLEKSALQAWAAERENAFGPGLDPSPSLRTAVFLALLDAKSDSKTAEIGLTYANIVHSLQSRGVLSAEVSPEGPVRDALRVAVSDLKRMLDNHLRYRVEPTREGRIARIYLAEIAADPARPPLETRTLARNRWANAFILLDPPIFSPDDIAHELIRKRRLSFSHLYAVGHAAAWWAIHSGKSEVDNKKRYEQASWVNLGLDTELKRRLATAPPSGQRPVVNLLGLGVGEGWGEIELIAHLLETLDRDVQIHYAALDVSPQLLVMHYCVVRDRFRAAIESGRLILAATLADIVAGLGPALARLRAGRPSSAGELLPERAPTIATCFGNTIGNDDPMHEDLILTQLLEHFAASDYVTLVLGVSLRRTQGRKLTAERDQYSAKFYEFLLQTPQHLLHDLQILSSSDPTREFTIPADLRHYPTIDARLNDEWITMQPYNGEHGLTGDRYSFYYPLQTDIWLAGQPKDRVPAGTRLMLYSVTKYDFETLKQFYQTLGMQVVDQPPMVVDAAGNNPRMYAVMALVRAR